MKWHAVLYGSIQHFTCREVVEDCFDPSACIQISVSSIATFLHFDTLTIKGFNMTICRSQWPCGLRRRSAAARLLRSWVRIPPAAWMFVCCECCVFSGRGLCDEMITRPEESYRLWCVVVCDLEISRLRRPWTALGHSAKKKKCDQSRVHKFGRQVAVVTKFCMVVLNICGSSLCSFLHITLLEPSISWSLENLCTPVVNTSEQTTDTDWGNCWWHWHLFVLGRSNSPLFFMSNRYFLLKNYIRQKCNCILWVR